jgi:hypothetical protein
MALDASSTAKGGLSSTNLAESSPARSADIAVDSEKALPDGDLSDAGYVTIGTRRLERVEAPLLRRKALDSDSSSSALSIGKQIEKEADNAIQYRSCSWQKVCFRL